MSAPHHAGTSPPRCDPFDLIRDASARDGIAPRGDGRERGNAAEPCQREEAAEVEEVGEVGAVVEPPRPASPTPAAPRALHRTARRERNSSVARAELLEMEREARALRKEEDAWYVRDGICAKVPPRVVREDASRRVNREEPARCRVPRYPPPLPRSLEVVPTIFVLEAKARREEEEVREVREELSKQKRRALAAAWAKVKSVAASSRARAAALATERARDEADRARAEAEEAVLAARAARDSLEKIQTRVRGSDRERFR